MPESPLLFDVNALVALSLTTHQHHRPAHRFLAGHQGRWATCPTTESALVRLLLNPAVTGSARRPQDVLAILGGMRNDPRWELLVDSSSLAEPVVDLTILSGHQQVTDVHLVNTDYVEVAYLDGFRTGELGKSGDSKRVLVTADCGLAVRAPKALAKVSDLSGG